MKKENKVRVMSSGRRPEDDLFQCVSSEILRSRSDRISLSLSLSLHTRVCGFPTLEKKKHSMFYFLLLRFGGHQLEEKRLYNQEKWNLNTMRVSSHSATYFI